MSGAGTQSDVTLYVTAGTGENPIGFSTSRGGPPTSAASAMPRATPSDAYGRVKKPSTDTDNFHR